MAKKEEPPKKLHHRIAENTILLTVLLLLLGGGIVAGYLYWKDMHNKVYIEKSEIEAPIISIGPAVPGILEKLYVDEGNVVSKGKVVAKVGDQNIEAKTNGIIVDVQNTPGQWITQQTALVKIVDPSELRVVGRVEEDKGLKEIKPGQKVMFTVDAFGSKQYEGYVEKIAQTARQTDIVFSISDKRAQNEFEIKVKFDITKYPELKNGMSAKMWVYKS